MEYKGFFIGLMLEIIVEIFLIAYINKRASKKSAIAKHFKYTIMCIIGWCTTIEMQILVINFAPNISPLYIDYLVYPFVALSPVALFYTAVSMYSHTDFKAKKVYSLLYIIPILTIFILWTNSIHGLFYKVYSINPDDTVFGPYFYIHSFYTYGLFALDIFLLIRNTVKHSGAFSKQSIYITIGVFLPLLINGLGMTVLDMNIYVTPLSLFFTIAFMSIAIFRYDFLNVAPIA